MYRLLSHTLNIYCYDRPVSILSLLEGPDSKYCVVKVCDSGSGPKNDDVIIAQFFDCPDLSVISSLYFSLRAKTSHPTATLW